MCALQMHSRVAEKAKEEVLAQKERMRQTPAAKHRTEQRMGKPTKPQNGHNDKKNKKKGTKRKGGAFDEEK